MNLFYYGDGLTNAYFRPLVTLDIELNLLSYL